MKDSTPAKVSTVVVIGLSQSFSRNIRAPVCQFHRRSQKNQHGRAQRTNRSDTKTNSVKIQGEIFYLRHSANLDPYRTKVKIRPRSRSPCQQKFRAETATHPA